MRVALIGYTGYWGQRLDRILTGCGFPVERFNRENIDDLEESDADAAFIATPPDTHYALASKAMRLGMDVFLEKPMAMTPRQAVALHECATQNDIVLAIDSTFLFSKTFDYLADLPQALISYQSLRTSPPMPQAKINAAWDMCWHDLAILHGLGCLESGQGVVDGSVASAALTLPSGGSAFMFASRIWPHKLRTITLHFTRDSFVWTLEGLRKVDGTVCVVEDHEPLLRAVEHFVGRCREREVQGLTDGQHGIAVTQAIDRIFTKEIDGGRYAEEYESCAASSARST